MKNTGLAALSFAFLLSGAALAAENVTPQAGNWTIGPISGSALCSMKNTYGNGHMLVFARGADGANSLAVDYGAGALQPGRQYPVDLDLPPLLSRNITAVAATDRVLLLNLGGDGALTDALARTGAIYVTAQGAETGYALAGSSDALTELQGCARALSGGKKQKPAKAAAKKSAPSPEIARLKAELESARRQAAEQQAFAEVARKEAAHLKSAAAMARDEGAKTAAPDKALLEKLRTLEAENARLRAVAAAPPENKIVKILSASGVVPESGLSPQISPGAQSWRWESDGIFGAAEAREVPPGPFAARVEGYFARMSSLCTGDFAKTAAAPVTQGDVTMQTAEMACIGDRNDAAAALVFVGDDKTFTVITQEGATGQMDAALARRNALAASVF